MTMASFSNAPRKGHLPRLKRIFGYLRKFPNAMIHVNVNQPKILDTVPQEEMDWKYSVYGNPKEEWPEGAPEPRGPEVYIATFVDANLHHCKITGRAVTGILHFLNSMVWDWYSKKQPTVQSATYGSEFMAAKIAVHQRFEIRDYLRHL